MNYLDCNLENYLLGHVIEEGWNMEPDFNFINGITDYGFHTMEYYSPQIIAIGLKIDHNPLFSGIYYIIFRGGSMKNHKEVLKYISKEDFYRIMRV